MHLIIAGDNMKKQLPIEEKKTHRIHWLVLRNDLSEGLNQTFFTNYPKTTKLLIAPGLIIIDGGNIHKYELAQFTHLRFYFQQMFRNFKNVCGNFKF